MAYIKGLTPQNSYQKSLATKTMSDEKKKRLQLRLGVSSHSAFDESIGA